MRRLPPLLTVLVAILFTFLVGLGVWQLQRGEEKAEMLSKIADRSGLAPAPLPQHAEPDAWAYRPVEVRCTPDAESLKTLAGRNLDGRSGFAHIVACVRASDILLIDLGWGSRALSAGDLPALPEEFAGIARPAGSFAARFDGRARAAELMVVASAAPRPLVPSAPPNPADIPDNHLSYAVQWFAFAAVLLAVFVIFLRQKRAPKP